MDDDADAPAPGPLLLRVVPLGRSSSSKSDAPSSYYGPMPDRHTLLETEKAMSAHAAPLTTDPSAAHAVSSLYRAANAVRNHMTNTVLREHNLTWTGFVVLWIVWIWDGMETRHAAQSAGVSKATLTGVVRTLESRGLITRESDTRDRRLV